MKKIFIPLLLVLINFTPLFSLAEFPDKPIRIVVYTGPGGLMDITARKLGSIIEEQGAGVPIIVENKKGAGGILALSHILRKPSDGYTVFGLTNSVISKVIQSKQGKKLDNLQYLARVVTDYECIIARKDRYPSLQTAIIDGKSKGGAQIWTGPAFGGTDYLFGLKAWNAFGIKGKWVPYTSGGEAIAALLGKHGDLYVGNPQDVAGRSDLHILAVASGERLPQFPNTPTFKELGYDQLTDEMLWRGFALRKGTSSEAVTKLNALFQKATQSESWKRYLDSGAMSPAFDTGKNFEQLVLNQIKVDQGLLQ